MYNQQLPKDFAKLHITQVIGDNFSVQFTVEDSGVNQSYTGYSFEALILNRDGATASTLSVATSTTTVADDTITVSGAPGILPTDEGTFAFYCTFTSPGGVVFTPLFGTIEFVKKTKVY